MEPGPPSARHVASRLSFLKACEVGTKTWLLKVYRKEEEKGFEKKEIKKPNKIRVISEKTKVIEFQKENKKSSDKKPRNSRFSKVYTEKSSLFFIKSMSVVCDSSCESEWSAFLQSEKTIKHSQKILSNLDFAYQEHGKNQAYARIMAIESLRKGFDRGGIEPIENTINSAFSNIVLNKKYKGYRQDLSDLLALWVELFGKKNILENPSLFFSRFNYKPIYKDIYINALASAYPKIVANKKDSLIFKEMIKSYD